MRALHVLAAGVTAIDMYLLYSRNAVIIIKKNQKEVPSALKMQTGGYWPLQFLSCLPLFLLLLHFFCLSTAKCSWSHTKENEGHERKEMKLDISGLHIGQGLVIFVLYVLFSHFLFSSRIECKIFHQVPYTNTYLQIDATSLTGSLFSDLDLSYYHTLMLLFLIF